VSESFPSRIPDLWAGQPLRLYARYDGAAEDVSVRVSGTVGTRPYTIELPVDVAPPDARHEAVITAWARAKIGDLTRRISNRERLRDAVVDVALDYGLVTRWTSLVAVDDELSACGPSDVDVRIPNQLPADMAGVGGIIGERSTQYGYGAYGYGVGGGGSAYGTGHAHYSAKGRAGIGTVGGDAIIIGSLDKSPIDAVIRREYNRLRYCYQRELQKAPDLAGKIVMAFTIGRDGSVVTAAVKESTMKNQLVEQCVTSRILRLQFDPLAGGGVVKVTYPFLFSTVQAESSPSR
jgi:hypothetical protein